MSQGSKGNAIQEAHSVIQRNSKLWPLVIFKAILRLKRCEEIYSHQSAQWWPKHENYNLQSKPANSKCYHCCLSSYAQTRSTFSKIELPFLWWGIIEKPWSVIKNKENYKSQPQKSKSSDMRHEHVPFCCVGGRKVGGGGGICFSWLLFAKIKPAGGQPETKPELSSNPGTILKVSMMLSKKSTTRRHQLLKVSCDQIMQNSRQKLRVVFPHNFQTPEDPKLFLKNLGKVFYN